MLQDGTHSEPRQPGPTDAPNDLVMLRVHGLMTHARVLQTGHNAKGTPYQLGIGHFCITSQTVKSALKTKATGM